MKLADFIRSNMQALLKEWDAFALTIDSADSLGKKGLRDHAREMLEWIANEMDMPPGESSLSDAQPMPSFYNPVSEDTPAEVHGLDRLDAGFSINETISEYRALRVNVLQSWMKTNKPPFTCEQFEDLMHFNQALDQSMDEALASYSSEKERGTRLLRTVLSASTDQTFVLDPQGRFRYANPATVKLFDKTTQAIIGKSCFDLGFDFAASMERSLAHVIRSGESYRGEFSFNHGAVQQFEYILSPVIFDEQASSRTVEAVVAIARDITVRKAAEALSWQQANFDMLTELPNRRLFLDRLQQDLRHAERAQQSLAVMFIDLDGFKIVNDSMGHDAGDNLLVQVAERLRTCVRESDTVARMGGDEFTVTLSEIASTEDVLAVAQKILDSLASPFNLESSTVRISASIGIANYPADAIQAEDLIKAADLAMFRSKEAGRNGMQQAVSPLNPA